ncbi:PTS transporter subunit EIIB [Psychromonas sp. Urea-02u-13]|uniref:PTS transporter subunit EIIB n=1 Tax=Psychromonas sp. Urea-02u-13 TaxID=2058326 RepID=UPI000C32B10B|nr:PTS transporter subunit EIIB [Psychromonas sp. Urea-02u-13]PKG39901.1 hypothetical protein CXF74_06105 [Psychromonas sp. Urea-02u-13]
MEETIQEVINAVGGKDNIDSCTNCMTRLRLSLKDKNNADHLQIKRISGVFGVIETDQQLQIVLGPGKAQKAAEVLKNLVA